MKNKTLFITLWFVIAILIAAICYVLVMNQRNQAQFIEVQQQSIEQKQQLQNLTQEQNLVEQNHQQALAEAQAKALEAIEKAKQEADSRVLRVAELYQSLFNNNEKTVQHLLNFEEKVQAGIKLQEAELVQLNDMIYAISQLKSSYQLNLGEFDALINYFKNKSSIELNDPKETTGFFRRIFSAKYKTEKENYHQQLGAKEAYKEAEIKLQTAYSSVQTQLANINFEQDKHLSSIQKLLETKLDSQQALIPLFSETKKILKTHEQMKEFNVNEYLVPVDSPRQ